MMIGADIIIENDPALTGGLRRRSMMISEPGRHCCDISAAG